MTKNINKIYSSVIKSSYGLSMGAIWQHISIEYADLFYNYPFRKQLFFAILDKLLNDKVIRLAKSGIFLSGTVEQQIQILQSAWPAYPSEDEDDDLDECGMWFLVKAPAGVVWLTPDGKELWT